MSTFIVFIFALAFFFRAKRIPGIPGPPGVPILGNTLEVAKNYYGILDYLVRVSKEYSVKGKPCQITIMGVPNIVILNDVGSFEYILKTTSQDFVKGPQWKQCFQELLGDGIFNADGDLWRQQRKTASFLFTMRNLKDNMADVIASKIQCVIMVLEKSCDDSQPVDLQDLFFRFTFDSFVQIAFGIDLHCISSEDPHVFQKSFDEAQQVVFERFISPVFLWKVKRFLQIGSEKNLSACVRSINRFVAELISNQKKLFEEEKETATNLVSIFLKQFSEQHIPLSDQYLRDVALNFIIAGRDTTAQTLSWFFWLMTQNQSVESDILQEISEAHDQNHLFSAQDSSSLSRLDAALKETLRLYPPVPADNKMCLKDTVLPNGCHIPRGTMVVYSMYNLARREDVWGKDAGEFNPNRWVLEASPSPFKFCSFNAGPRMCLGKAMAMMELKMVASSLLSHFEFKLEPGQDVAYGASITLPMRNPLLMRVKRRSSNK